MQQIQSLGASLVRPGGRTAFQWLTLPPVAINIALAFDGAPSHETRPRRE